MAEKANLKKKMNNYYFAVGRRKSSVATIRLSNGDGTLLVNELDYKKYFNNKTLEQTVIAPLKLVGKIEKVSATIKVRGGGKSGQAQAVSLAIARSLNLMSDDLRSSLKKAKHLTRDPRKKERKKYGLKKARKAPQFSKR